MRSDATMEANADAARPAAARRADAAHPSYPDQETVDYYIAKANTMRARSYRRVASFCWRAIRRFARRQLSPYTRVKLPSTMT